MTRRTHARDVLPPPRSPGGRPARAPWLVAVAVLAVLAVLLYLFFAPGGDDATVVVGPAALSLLLHLTRAA